eukprot:9572160-Ditylum_brightwellii.AAC.1
MTRRQLYSFIGMTNYYRDTWHGYYSKVLAPPTPLMSKTTKWKWTSTEQEAFEWAKEILSREILLVYPDFSILFNTHIWMLVTPILGHLSVNMV